MHLFDAIAAVRSELRQYLSGWFVHRHHNHRTFPFALLEVPPIAALIPAFELPASAPPNQFSAAVVEIAWFAIPLS